MTNSLALRYRPASFRELVGQTPVAAVLYRMLHEGPRKPLAVPRVPHAILFAGNHGCGKTSTARILGAALNCTADGDRPCGQCTSCRAVAAGTSLDVFEVDAAGNSGVAEIRRIRDLVQYSSPGAYRVVLLDEAHSLSRDAFNALLKVLEEPPERTIFVLLTTEPARIMSTIVSRCVTFTFRRLPVAVIRDRLAEVCAKEGFGAEPALLTAIAERADGGMRDALMLLDQMACVSIFDLERFEQLMGESDFGPALIGACAAGDHKAMFAQLDEVLSQTGDYAAVCGRVISCLRDLLVLQAGGELAITGRALAARQALAARLSPQEVTAAMRVLWDLRTKVRGGSPRAELELAVVMVSERLAARTRQPAPAAGNGHHPATVDQLRALAGAAQ